MFCFLLSLTSSASDENFFKTPTLFRSCYKNGDKETELDYNPTLGYPNTKLDLNISLIPSTPIVFQDTILTDFDPVDKNYDDLIFNFSELLRLDPPSLTDLELNTYTPNNFTISIENVQNSESVTIKRIYSNSPDIYVQKYDEKTIRPARKATISFAIIAHDYGHNSGNIFIETSLGTILYYIDYRATNNPIISVEAQHIYQIYQHPFEYLLNISYLNNYTMLFDSAVFNPHKTFGSICALSLTPNFLDYGIYQTFVYIRTTKSTIIIPIYVHITDENMVITNDLVFGISRNEIKYITIHNPTENTLNVTSISCQDNKFKANLTEKYIVIYPFQYKRVAYVQAAYRVNTTFKFNGTIYRSNMSLTINEKSYYINLALRKYPAVTKAAFYRPPVNDYTTIAVAEVANFNKEPVVVFSAKLNSPFYSIKDFIPCILSPSKFSSEFFITLIKDFDALEKPLDMTIFTNSSIYRYSVIRYAMPVNLQVNTVNVSMSHNTITFGNVYNGSTRSLSFRIGNDNHIPIKFIEAYSTSQPLEVNHSKNFCNQTILPGQSMILKLDILFKNQPTSEDRIIFEFEHCKVKINLVWRHSFGRVDLNITLHKDLILGSDYQGYVTAVSHFDQEIKIVELETDVAQLKSVNLPIILKNNQKIVVSDIVLKLERSFPLTRGFFKIISSDDSYDAQKQAWESLWTSELTVPIEVKLLLESGFSFNTQITVNISHAAFPQGIIDFGTIHADEIFCKSINLHNPFSRPILFNFHGVKNGTDGKYNIKHRKVIVVESHESSEFMLTFEGTIPGKYSLEIPVTTNCTPPFTILVSATVEYPRIRFSDIDHNMVTHIEFDVGDDDQYMLNKWTKCVYVTNNALSPISMNNLYITPNTFVSFRANKTNLQPYQTCSICFDFSLWLFDSDSQNGNISFTVLAQHYLYTLPIYVKISQKAVDQVNAAVRKTMEVISVIGMLSPFVSFIVGLIILIWFRSELNWRLKRVDRAVKHYSVKEYTQMEVQKDEVHDGPTKQWVKKRNWAPRAVSDSTLQIMAQMIQ